MVNQNQPICQLDPPDTPRQVANWQLSARPASFASSQALRPADENNKPLIHFRTPHVRFAYRDFFTDRKTRWPYSKNGALLTSGPDLPRQFSQP